MNKNNELQEELEFLSRYFDSFFEKYAFILTIADYGIISFSNKIFTLSFHYDSRYGMMIFGGLSLTINKSNNKFYIEDLIEYITEDKEIVKSYDKQNITDQEKYSLLINQYLLDIFEKSDCGWEKPLLEIAKNKFQW